MRRATGVVAIGTAQQAAEAIQRFDRCAKLVGWLVLHAAGLPAPPGIIVTNWDDAVAQAVDQFARQWHSEAVLVRSDSPAETALSPRGGFLSSRLDVTERVRPWLDEGRVCFLLEPLSPFDDLYSLSLEPDPLWELWEVEVVGPGYDASDLKRGDVTPLERISIEAADAAVRVASRIISSDETQAVARQIRFEKIAALLGGSIDSVAETLRLRGETLLLDNPTYPPIPPSLLERAVRQSHRLKSELEKRGLAEPGVLLSMSYVGRSARPVFWDVVWPASKYVGTTGKFRSRTRNG